MASELDGLNDTGRTAFISALVMLILAFIAVSLRFISKLYITKQSWALDDWLLVGGTACFCAWFGVQVWGLVKGGGGRNIQDPGFDFSRFQLFLEALYTLEPLYGTSVTLIKLSILVFLHRVFFLSQRSITIYSLYTICIIWWIVYTITTCVNCRPVKKFWDPLVEGTCYNYALFFLGIEIVDVLINFSILCAPLRILWGLQMPVRKKVLASSLFVFGGFVCITGTIRLALTYIPGSTFISFSQALLWTNIHIGTAIICACLPLYARMLSGFVEVLGSWGNAMSNLLLSTFGRSSEADADVEQGLNSGSLGKVSHATSGKGGKRSDVSLDTMSTVPEDRIKVNTTYTVS